jgi:hypothetical protein
VNRKSNLKVVEEKPEKLTWHQVDQLARSLEIELMQEVGAAELVMLLMQEIALHPFDHSHVEMIANLVNLHLFAGTREADAAFRELMRRERERVQKGGGA